MDYTTEIINVQFNSHSAVVTFKYTSFFASVRFFCTHTLFISYMQISSSILDNQYVM